MTSLNTLRKFRELLWSHALAFQKWKERQLHSFEHFHTNQRSLVLQISTAQVSMQCLFSALLTHTKKDIQDLLGSFALPKIPDQTRR